MADNIESRVSDLEMRQAVQDEKFNALMRSMDDFRQEMRDFKMEMRQQNEMRAREIAELRARQDADTKALLERMDKQQARHDQSMEQLRQDVKDISKEVRNLFFAFVGIIVAIMVGMFWTR